jgi:pimeloyl-ACP methyl ester carboxylesterase
MNVQTRPAAAESIAMNRVPEFVTSADGTRIAVDRFGEGPPLIVVGGILCDRQRTHPLAEALGRYCSVINLDRRERGDSRDTAPYAIAREIEDLAAAIELAGGRVALHGHSSGAGLALNAAASGLPITHLVLHEPPYGDDDEASRRSARELAQGVVDALNAQRPADAISGFMAAAGVPPEMVEAMVSDPSILAMASTMRYDIEVMGELGEGGTLPEALVRAVTVPTLVIAGAASPDFFRNTASRIASQLPGTKYVVLEGQDHGADPTPWPPWLRAS